MTVIAAMLATTTAKQSWIIYSAHGLGRGGRDQGKAGNRGLAAYENLETRPDYYGLLKREEPQINYRNTTRSLLPA